MATNDRDVSVNLKGDASSLLKAIADSKAALEQLRVTVANLDQMMQRIAVVLNNENFGIAFQKSMSGAASTVVKFSADATGQILRVDDTVRQQLAPGFDMAQVAAQEMASAVATGAQKATVTIDDLGRVTVKTSQATGLLSAEEQKLRIILADVLAQLQKMELGARLTNQLTLATQKYNQQLITTRQYLNEVARIQSRAGLDAEAAARKTEVRAYAAAATLLMLGRRAMRVGKEIMGSFSETAEAIFKMQMIMGGTTEELSKLKFAGEQMGVSAKEITTRMGLLEAHLAKNDTYAQRLGVSYKNLDGSLKSPLQVLGEVGDRLNSIDDAFVRSTVAREVFGRGYQALEPLLRQGSKGMAEAAAQAERLGRVYGQDAVNNGVRYRMAMRQMHEAAGGLGAALAQVLAPPLAIVAQLVMLTVNALRQLFSASNGVGRVLRIVAPIIAGVAGALLGAAVAFRVARLAAAVFNREMWMSPVTWVTLAVVALIAAVVYLAKNFSWGTKVVAFFGAALGAIIGGVVSAAIITFQVLTAQVMAFLFALGKVGGWLSHIPGLGWLKGPSDALSDFVVNFEKKLTGLALKAPKAGWDLGYKYGKAAGDAIKNMKLPSLGDLAGGGEEPSWDKGPTGGGGGGGGRAKSRVLTMFENIVAQARDALNAIREKAKEAKKEMDDMAKSVSDSLSNAFSLSELAGQGYIGPKGLLRIFQRKLNDMRQFAANVRKLRGMGLPVDMMVDIVNAGVSGGSQIAKMLVANPQAITELMSLRDQVQAEAGGLGQFVAQAQYGPQIAGYIADALARQAQFGRLVVAGKPMGYKPTSADIEAMTADIANQVYMNVGTNASVADIEQAIAWALKTGAGMRGMVGAGGPGMNWGWAKGLSSSGGWGMTQIGAGPYMASSSWEMMNHGYNTPGSAPMGTDVKNFGQARYDDPIRDALLLEAQRWGQA